MRSVAAPGGPDRYEFEFRIVLASGEVRWMWTRGQVTRDAEGRARRRIGVVADVTARKLAEEARQLSEERYALAMEASEEGHFDWDVRSDGLFASAQLKKMLGLPADMRYLTRSEMVASMPYYPGDRERVGQEAGAVLAGRALQHEFEYRLLRGRELRWIRARWKIFRDSDGAAQRVIGVINDITERKLAGEALWLSEERYALAMEVAEEGHLDWNVPSDEFFASAQAKRVLNVPLDAEFRSRQDVMGRVPYHPDDLPRVAEEWRASLAGRGTEHEFQYRILRGAELRWIRARWKIFRDAQGKAQRVIGVVSDITERKQAADTLRISESRFRALTELSSDAYWAQDENLRFLPTGTKYDLAGYRSDEHVGMTRWELPDAMPLSATWAEHQALLEAGKPFRDFEYRRTAPDGSVRYLSISGAPVFDDQGRFRGYQGVGRDITARKRAEEEIRESEARFRGLVELSSDWYWQQDENLRFVGYVPPEVGERSGVAAASSLGKTRWEFDNVTPLSGTWEDHKAVLAARQPFRDFEYVRVDENGVPHYTVISGVPLFDGEGRFVGYHGVGRNISERRRMEEDVRQSEARFRRMSELSADTYWEQDENFRYTRTGSGHDIAGYVTDVNQGKTRWEMTGEPAPLATSWQEHQAMLAAHQPFRDFEYRRRRPDGTMGYYSASGAPMFDPDGRFRGYQGVARDITEFRRVEEDLRESEGRFRVLTELSADWYWQQDEQLRFTYLSRQGATGLPTEAALGKARWDFDQVRPLSGSWDEHQALLAARQPFRDLELIANTPDGTVSYVSISGAPIFDEQGSFKGYQGTGRNITDRKRIEEELRQSEERYSLAVAGSNEGIFDWDLVSDRVYVSHRAQELFGLPGGELWRPRRDWRHILAFHPDDTPRLHDGIKAHIEGRSPTYDVEFRIILAGGELRWFRQRGIALRDASGKAYRVVGSIGDVTETHKAEEELKSLERQLRQAQRLEAMGTLAGGIAHDFNNILGAILGYGEMALRDAAKGSRLRRDLDSIVVAGERGRALVDRVLAFSRSGVGERVPVHVEKVVREALDLISAKLPPNVTLHGKLHADGAAMLGDATQVHQVVMNLATNAVQAMPAGGTLRVHLDAQRIDTSRVAAIGMLTAAEYLVLKVADTGTGIAPRIMERIFDPFFTTKEVGTGTGLGLSLVHGIVTELGGAIDVASTVGAGSTFTVYLPRSGDAVDQSEQEETEMPRGDGQRVLVVDDEEPLVRLATRTLEELGYAPTGFTSSIAALAAFRADPKRFDALITDERMPGLSGSALIREVRGIRGGIPIVLMSGYVGAAIARRAIEAGAEEVLKKPLSARDLAASLARVLHS
jgi:PAS domain S-box-containing protein